MKKLVLLLMLFGALRSFGAVATNVQNLSQFGTTNRAMPGDGIGLSTRYGTAGERLYGLRITNLVSTINALGAGTNTVLLSAGTNVIISTNRTGSNVTYTISVATNDLGVASSMTNALLYAGPTNGSVGALILTAGDNIILSTSGTNRVITTSNNVSLVDVTNIISTATNDILATVTNIANVSSTNNVKVTAGTNIVVVTNVSGNVVTYQVNSGIDTNIFVTTNLINARLGSNFINLSVQAAKLPGNDNPAIGSGYKNWELVYYKTNTAGSIAALSANWQFVVPIDYATNSLRLYMQQMILQTNGPAASNTIFCASVFKSTPGDSRDIHTNTIFNAEVCVTNTWGASTSGTNILQSSVIELGTNAPIQAGDFVVLNLKRSATNDTYIWESAVVGLQLLYSRP